MIDDSYSKALLHMDGADTSTTFTDESGKTWTARGTAQIDTAQSVFGGASGLFDGNSDWIDTPDHDDWYLDDGSNANAWTFDARIRFASVDVIQGLISQHVGVGNYWHIKYTNSSGIGFILRESGTVTVDVSWAWSPSINTWYHVAVVKQGTTGYRCYIDGTEIGAAQTDESVMPNQAAILWIGLSSDASSNMRYFNGWMDEVRVSKGIARWTANFTPQTYAYGRGGGFMMFSS